MAVQLFQGCNDKADVLLAEHIFFYYDTRQNFEDVEHLGLYLNMQVEKYVYINGSHKNQLKIFDFLANNVRTRFGNKYTKAIRNKIKHIRNNVRYYN